MEHQFSETGDVRGTDRPDVNGSREVARRRRQIAAGQLKKENGLHLNPKPVVKPKKRAPRKVKVVA